MIFKLVFCLNIYMQLVFKHVAFFGTPGTRPFLRHKCIFKSLRFQIDLLWIVYSNVYVFMIVFIISVQTLLLHFQTKMYRCNRSAKKYQKSLEKEKRRVRLLHVHCKANLEKKKDSDSRSN